MAEAVAHPWEVGYRAPRASEAFDGSASLPASVMDTLAWLDAKDAALRAAESLVRRAYEAAAVDAEWLADARRLLEGPQ